MPKTIKTYPCQICQSKFSKPSTLKTHMYRHTGEKPFKCNYPFCGSEFSVISNLRRHIKIHTKGHMEKEKTISPQERLYYVKQLVLKTQQQQQISHQVKNTFILPKLQYGCQDSGPFLNSKPQLSHISFCDLYQSFVNYDYDDGKAQ